LRNSDRRTDRPWVDASCPKAMRQNPRQVAMASFQIRSEFEPTVRDVLPQAVSSGNPGRYHTGNSEPIRITQFLPIACALGKAHEQHDYLQGTDRQVQEENEAPAEGFGQPAAQQRACRRPRALSRPHGKSIDCCAAAVAWRWWKRPSELIPHRQALATKARRSWFSRLMESHKPFEKKCEEHGSTVSRRRSRTGCSSQAVKRNGSRFRDQIGGTYPGSSLSVAPISPSDIPAAKH